VPGLGTSFGRGGATTAQWDLQNAQCIVIQGSNMAENHPVAFRFVMKAKERGATIIHVDPRFSRTSAMADIYVPIRPGTDIAWLGGLINYVINSERWNNDPFFKEYVINYTNAAILINPNFKDTEDLNGLFSGYSGGRSEDAAIGTYDVATWQYRGEEAPAEVGTPHEITSEPFSETAGRPTPGPPPRDLTLQDPYCVFQILKRHYARYTPEMVERVCGVPRELFLKVAETLLENAGRERTTTWCYAVGWTQHTVGVQIIRACAILQLLLGNIGRPGGGILALRGHATIQGSTDIPTLYNLLPGYLPQPSALRPHESLARYLEAEYPPTGWWANAPKYLVSLLKAWYGEAARRENDYCFDYLPRISGDHSQLPMMQAIHDGQIKGLFLLGQNPAVGGHNAGFVRRALANLEWMVVRDAYENETAAFWYASPEVQRGELDPTKIKTEVFLLPAALVAEKEGSFTNTHRLIQWHDKAVEPPGDARSETWFLFHLGKRLRELYAQDPDQHSIRVRQLLDLTWAYPTRGPHQEPDVEAVLQEINGYWVADRRPVKDFTELQADGSTACGCWIYSGVMPEPGRNLARNRRPDPPEGPGTHLNWGFAWPANRRILYNRAAADPEGRPWSQQKRYIWWDAEKQEWTGYDVPDFPRAKRPDYEPDWSTRPRGIDAHSGRAPFIMNTDGVGWLFVPHSLKDGPLPAHYEPVESPVENALYRQQFNPVAKLWERPENLLHAVGDPRYPYIITTYRLTEHHTGGTMTRYVPWLAEVQPEGFVEISPELAAEKGIQNGDWVTLSTARGEVETRALVTPRLRPLNLHGRTIHVIGMPWHFGYKGLAQGDVANTLSAMVGDPNVSIHEGKVFTCNLRPGRKGQP
jgi:formate dehydrogenase major subunit